MKIFFWGGDWNATWDNRPVETNIDVINMRDIPCRRHSANILNMRWELNLADPYRIFFPITREFTYIPNAVENINRLRIDYFCVSNILINQCCKCSISTTVISNTFDHKQIFLTTKNERKKQTHTVKDQILKDKDLKNTIKTVVFDCYLQHAADTNFEQGQKELLNEMVGTILDHAK